MRRLIPQREQRACVLLVGGNPVLHTALKGIVATDLALYRVAHSAAKNPPADTAHQLYADLNNPASVQSLFTRIAAAGDRPELVIFQPDLPKPLSTLNLTAHDAEHRWQGTGLSLFLIAQAALQVMTSHKHGSLIILGSTLAINSQENMSLNTAMYAGMRALSQSLAREFHPQGIHVVHVALSDLSGNDENAKMTADLCWQLHQQPSNAWTQEVMIGD